MFFILLLSLLLNNNNQKTLSFHLHLSVRLTYIEIKSCMRHAGEDKKTDVSPIIVLEGVGRIDVSVISFEYTFQVFSMHELLFYVVEN